MSDHTPTVIMADNLWKRIAIAATACVLFVVLASSFTPGDTNAADGPTPEAERTAMPGTDPADDGEAAAPETMPAPPTPVIPTHAIGDVARADSPIIGTLEGVRYSVSIHAAATEPLYSVWDRDAGMEVASLLSGRELRDAFPELRDVREATGTAEIERFDLMYINPNDV